MSRTVVRRNLTAELGEGSADARERRAVENLGWEPERPGSKPPVLPDELTELSDAALMKMFSQSSKWAEFVGYELAKAQIAESRAEELVEKLGALQQIKNKTGRVAAMKASQWEDESYAAARSAHGDAYAHRKLVEALYNNVDRDTAVLSRELTRRVGRSDREGRNNRYSDRGRAT